MQRVKFRRLYVIINRQEPNNTQFNENKIMGRLHTFMHLSSTIQINIIMFNHTWFSHKFDRNKIIWFVCLL